MGDLRNRLACRLRGDGGFTLIECLVASVVLLVGLLGTFALIDGAQGSQGAARTREGATNLSREFIEAVRGYAYTAVMPAVLTATLQTMSGYDSTSGSTVIIKRRGTTYSVTTSVCSIDDAKDGLGATDASFCSPSVPTSPADNQPDDLKQVRVTVAWSGRRAPVTPVTQSAMLSSTGAAVGLPTQTFAMDSPTNIGAAASAPIISPASTVVAPCATNVGCFTAGATGATRIIFAVDGADQGGAPVTMDSTCSALPCPKWHFAWNYAGLSDGVYRITARSVDANGVQGGARSILVTLSRGGTSRPCRVGSTPGNCLAVEGGYNYLPGGTTTPIFELRWQANPERNVVGYKVQTGTGAPGSGTPVCALDAQGDVTSPSGQSPASAPNLDSYACIDLNPPAPGATPAQYSVYAQYSNGATGAIVDGPVATVSQVGGAAASTSYATQSKSFGFYNGAAANGCAYDMRVGWAGSGSTVASANGPTTVTFCSPTIGSMFAGASAVMATTNASLSVNLGFNHTNSQKDCWTTWALTAGASTLGSNTTGFRINGGAGNPVRLIPLSWSTTTMGSTPALASTDRVRLDVTFANANGTVDCNLADVRYGGSPAPGTISVDFSVGTTVPSTLFPRPNQPTAVTKTTSGADTNVSWTASAGGNVAFYRIYRDGRLYSDRYDTCEVGDLRSAGGCDNGNGTFTVTDEGSTGHSYWVTAVYGTGTPVASTLAESAQVAAT